MFSAGQSSDGGHSRPDGFLSPNFTGAETTLTPLAAAPASICSGSLRRGAHTTGHVAREFSWVHVKARSKRGPALCTAAVGVLRWQLSQLRNPRLCWVKP